MSTEVERKYLATDGWQKRAIHSDHIVQGYLAVEPNVVRIRVMNGNQAYLTIKGPKQGISCYEFETEIDVAEAKAMLNMVVGKVIAKRRHVVLDENEQLWEVDVFENRSGLVLAEIELPSAETPVIEPDWLLVDVSEIQEYTNAYMAMNS